MNRLDPDQPSIFSRPDPEVESRRPAGPTGQTEQDVWRPSRPSIDGPIRPAAAPPASTVVAGEQGMRRQFIVLGSMGLGILALAGFIAASILAPPADDAALAGASSSPTATASVRASAVLSADPSASPSASTAPTTAATPLPTPAGPPHEVATGGWATVAVDELNVREAAGLDQPRAYGLIRGAVVHVAEGPVDVDGRNWYRVASLGGATGWATSGPESSPFLTTISRGGDLLQCGPVTGRVFADNDSLEPGEILHVGALALPGDAFDGGALGSLELVRAIGGEACVTAVVGGDGRPVVRAQVNGAACGHPVARRELIELHPRAGMDVVAEYQVKDVALVHPEILDPLQRGDAITRNLEGLLVLAAQGDDSWGCIHHSASPEGTGSGGIQLDFRLCAVVELVAADRVVARAASAADEVTFAVPGTNVDPTIALGSEASMIVWGFDNRSDRHVDFAPYFEGGCT